MCFHSFSISPTHLFFDISQVRERVSAIEALEAYIYSMKNAISNDKGFGKTLSPDAKSKLTEKLAEVIGWLEKPENKQLEISAYKEKKTELESFVNTVLESARKESAQKQKAKENNEENQKQSSEKTEL